jgi:hypothetical protein
LNFEMLTLRLRYTSVIASQVLVVKSILGSSCYAAIGLQCSAESSYGRSR